MPDITNPDRNMTQMNMQWCQFVVYDITRTPLILANTPNCCPPYPRTHPECEAIFLLLKEDTLFKKWNQKYLRNVRSVPCFTCHLSKFIYKFHTLGKHIFLDNLFFKHLFLKFKKIWF